MAMGSIFLGIWTTFVFTDNALGLLWFTLFGILGGLSVGSLNGRKARTQTKYKNEYTIYAAMFFAAIVFLGVYYLFLAPYKMENKVVPDALEAAQVVYVAVLGGLLGLFGIGLAVANSLAE